ncbi:ferredoxin [Gemmobacter serpentinus]|uniref:ferredoxin n=1 Tax=Gemmobacter serpentinus TaxID=2652247 RepID=UPI00124E7B83|nr:ferredoxin [Gemmobacter serpentinus]
MTGAEIAARLAAHRLELLGGFHAEGDPGLPHGTRSLLLIGPAEPGFWPHATGSPEWQDGRPDPLDRWSRRVIGRIACDLRGKALFPFGGPPHHPFAQWALRSGRARVSPVQLTVHAEQGLWFSCRGALALQQRVDLPPPQPVPCEACLQPCRNACPVGALTGQGYDLPRCRAHLASGAGEARPAQARPALASPTQASVPQGCLAQGCAVRRACPLSQSYARLDAQSAYHMRQFQNDPSADPDPPRQIQLGRPADERP